MDHKYVYNLISSTCFGLLDHLQGPNFTLQADSQNYYILLITRQKSMHYKIVDMFECIPFSMSLF